MNDLDDPAVAARGDPGGMLRHLDGFPAQLREALEIGRSAGFTVSGSGVSSVVVVGMGGSAIGGELASAYLVGRLAVPFGVVR